MSKDWDALCSNFSALPDQSAASRKAFSAENGVNDNSFRRELSKYKKRNESGEPDTPATAKASSRKKVIKKTTKTTGKGKAGTRERKVLESVSDDGLTRAIIKRVPRQINESSADNITYDDGRSFKRGHTTSLIHGGFSKRLFESPTMAEFCNASDEDLLAMMRRRIFSVHSIRAEKMRALIEYYDSGRSLFREVLNLETQKVEKVPISFEEASEKIEMAGLETLGEYEKAYFGAKAKVHKMQFDAFNAKLYSAEEVVQITAQLLKQRTDEELSAIDTCTLFESNGVIPPTILIEEAKIELANAKDESDDSEGATQEELDARRKKSFEQRANREAELKSIRERNDRILSGGGGIGDVLETYSEEVED